jgi:hypothetical protein
MSRIDSLTRIRIRLTHVTTQVSPTSLERIRQAWAGVPMLHVSSTQLPTSLNKHETAQRGALLRTITSHRSSPLTLLLSLHQVVLQSVFEELSIDDGDSHGLRCSGFLMC